MRKFDRRSEEKQLKERKRQNANKKNGEYSDRSKDGMPENLQWVIREISSGSDADESS